MYKPLHTDKKAHLLNKLYLLSRWVMKFCFPLFVLFVTVTGINAQTSITSKNNGNWNSISTWTGNVVPTASDNATINNTVTIASGTTAEVYDLTINTTLIVDGTLIVRGNLDMNANGSELVTNAGANVIVLGNAILENKVTINLSSYFIVKGDFTKNGSHNQGELTITNAHLYILGNISVPSDNQGDPWQNFSVCSPGDYDGTTATENDECDAGQLDDFMENVGPDDLPDGIYDDIVGCETASLTLISGEGSDNQFLCEGNSIATIDYLVGGDATGASVTGLPNGTAGSFNSGVLSISGTPSESGSFTFMVRTTGTPSPCVEDTVYGTIIINDLPNNTTSGFSGSPICEGENGVLTFNALNGTFVTPYTIEYSDGITTWSQTITDDADFNFNVAVNPVETTNYSLVSITNGNGCTRTTDFGKSTARITVYDLPTITLDAASAEVCEGDMLTAFSFSATSGNPDGYSIDFDTSAESQGFVDVENANLSGGIIEITAPASGTPDTYNAELIVTNSTTGCESSTYNIMIVINPLPAAGEIVPD